MTRNNEQHGQGEVMVCGIREPQTAREGIQSTFKG
jgi:hypothetical protein